MTPNEASRILGKPAQWIRLGLQGDRLPFGCAVQGEGGRWSYDIRPERLAQYMGITTDELWDRLGREEIA